MSLLLVFGSGHLCRGEFPGGGNGLISESTVPRAVESMWKNGKRGRLSERGRGEAGGEAWWA
jgi:hypothetical protein